MERFLSSHARVELLIRHRRERDGRIKDRIKVVLLRDDGWNYESIAEALFLSDEGVRQQIQDYMKSDGKKLAPENGGSKSFLTQVQMQRLVAHLESHLYATVSDICHYVHKTYNIHYSVSGMTDWLEKNKFTFHRPCGVPSKANQEEQTKFVAHYEKLKRDLPEDEHIIFMDGAHPIHAVRFTKGWIKKKYPRMAARSDLIFSVC